jgi:hypothetical protein
MTGIINFAQMESTTVSLDRITEAGDTRITEAGDIRITGDATPNTAEGSLVANATKIPYNSTTYIKVSGIWKIATLYVKHSGTWKIPEAIYKKQSGIWKRAH